MILDYIPIPIPKAIDRTSGTAGGNITVLFINNIIYQHEILNRLIPAPPPLPLSLPTVLNKLNNTKYKTADQFASGVRLVFKNAKSYNMSARYSNTPSYTHTVTTMTTNTISPQKKLKRDFKKRMSHTPVPIRVPTKFNPGKKFSSVPAHQHYGNDVHNNNGAFAAQDILNTLNQSKFVNNQNFPPQNMHLVSNFGQNNIGNFHNMVKRKTFGGSAITLTNSNNSKKINKKKFKKKRIIRSRTFVSTTEQGKKYNCLETAKQLDKSTRMHQREATPEIDFAEQKSHRPVSSNNTPILSPTTPKTAPFHSVNKQMKIINQINPITLDDFQLDHALDNDFEAQHNSHKHPTIHHKQYYSQHINTQRKSQIPSGTPTITNAKSENFPNTQPSDCYRKNNRKSINLSQIQTNNNKNRKVRRKGTKNSDHNDSNHKSPHRNLGSFSDHELKGLLEADNLFTYSNYQKIVQ